MKIVRGSDSRSGLIMGDFTSFNSVQDQTSKLFQYLLKLILCLRFSIESEQRLSAAGPDQNPSASLNIHPNAIKSARYPIFEASSEHVDRMILCFFLARDFLFDHVKP